MTTKNQTILELFNKIEYVLDEFYTSLIEFNAEGILDRRFVEKANITRKLIILLCMIWQQVSCDEKTQSIAFDKGKFATLQPYDDIYTSIFDDLFTKYGWERPNFLNSSVELCSEDKEALEQELKVISPDFELGDFLFCFKNKKFDKVANLYIKSKKHNLDMTKEYDTIFSYCYTINDPLVCFPTSYDFVMNDDQCYFISTYDMPEDGFGLTAYVNPERLFSPKLLFLLPELDHLMDNFLEKWSKKGDK